MKYLFILALFIMPVVARGTEPATTCPAGYLQIDEPLIVIANDTCPSGYTTAGRAESCLVSSPQGVCMMYAPTDTSYSDDTGSYTYTTICPLN